MALRSQFRYAVRHQRQPASGAEALRHTVTELRRLSAVFSKPDVSLQEAVQAGKEIEQHVRELQSVVTAADLAHPASGQTVSRTRKRATE